MKKILLALFATAMLSAGIFAAETSPKTVIHVITAKWKPNTTPAQIDEVLAAAAAMPAQYAGITRVWTRPIKMQIPEGYDHIIVMEFASEAALKDYVDSAAQKKFYEVYIPIRQTSRTSDITN